MKVGMRLPNYARWFRGKGIWATCEKAKEMDLDALFFVDHVMFTPTQYVGYGNGYMDIWTAMSYVAAVTNIQGWLPTLSQNVVVIPYRPAIQQAKIAATVYSLSGGRLMIGAGSGYNENEFRALGLNIRERGDMTDEYLAAIKELWANPVASFHGKYVNFDEMTISVRPAQEHIPIMYGAQGPRPFRRIAERYDGWVAGGAGTSETVKTSEEGWAQINSLWEEYGREGKPYWVASGQAYLTLDRSQAGGTVRKCLDSPNQGTPQTVTLSGGPTYQRFEAGAERTYASNFQMMHPDELVSQARTCADMGADMFLVDLPSYRFGEFDNLGMQLNQMEIFAEHVMPKIPKG